MRSFASELLTRRQTTFFKKKYVLFFSTCTYTYTYTFVHLHFCTLTMPKLIKQYQLLDHGQIAKPYISYQALFTLKKHRSPLRKRDMMG